MPISVQLFAAIINHTPIYVWGILALLVWIGLRRTLDRTVRPSQIMLVPVISLSLALYGLVSIGISVEGLTGLAIGAVIGGGTGFAVARQWQVTPLANGKVRLKGDWFSLITFTVIFLNRYVMTVMAKLDPAMAASGSAHAVSGLISGLLVGFSVMRAVRWLGFANAPVRQEA